MDDLGKRNVGKGPMLTREFGMWPRFIDPICDEFDFDLC